MKRTAKEIAILKSIRHPSIIQLYEVFDTKEDVCFVMEYAEGGELFDMIVRETKLKENKAAEFFYQIISVLKYLHSKGIGHRDLKPENVLLNSEGKLKIIDFYLSNTYHEKEKLMTACGSPGYAAPEMIRGEAYDGYRVDIFSSGVVLFAMLGGFLPFEDANTANLYRLIMTCTFTIPSFVSEEASDMLLGILTPEQDARLDFDGILEHPWMKKNLIIPSISSIPKGIDEEVINLIATEKLKASDIKKYLKLQEWNHHTASYYIMLSKVQKVMKDKPIDKDE